MIIAVKIKFLKSQTVDYYVKKYDEVQSRHFRENETLILETIDHYGYEKENHTNLYFLNGDIAFDVKSRSVELLK